MQRQAQTIFQPQSQTSAPVTTDSLVKAYLADPEKAKTILASVNYEELLVLSAGLTDRLVAEKDRNSWVFKLSDLIMEEYDNKILRGARMNPKLV